MKRIWIDGFASIAVVSLLAMSFGQWQDGRTLPGKTATDADLRDIWGEAIPGTGCVFTQVCGGTAGNCPNPTPQGTCPAQVCGSCVGPKHKMCRVVSNPPPICAMTPLAHCCNVTTACVFNPGTVTSPFPSCACSGTAATPQAIVNRNNC